MNLLIILPSERALLATRRLDDKADNKRVMHALDSDVFHYLCSYTDWATGIIGQRSAVSYYRIASALTEDIPRKPSRTLRKVNRNDVRNSVKRLIRVGVFINESIESNQRDKKQHALILHRPFWQALLTAQHLSDNSDTQQLSGFIAELLKRKMFNNSHLDKNNSADSYAADATYNKPINITNAKSTSFQLSLTWHYDENLVELFLQAAGFSAKQIKQVWFGKYVQYWSGETITRTQREWSLHFANHMQGYLLRPDYFEKVNGMLEQPVDRDTATRKTKTVPMFSDGSQLQTWAIAQGLPTAPVGATTTQYYQLLCNKVERKRTMQERGGRHIE
jgi:hypothetical protein